MSRVTKVKAVTNGEVAYISWQIDSMINGCLGFEITRITPDDPTQNRILAAWVPFQGQSNPKWDAQDTSVWPVQKLSWRDLTLIKSRDSLNTRDQGFHVQYLVRPVVAYDSALQEITTTLPVTYTGNPVKLSYLDTGCLSNVITVTTQYGNIRATFTNGILATQWLTNVLKNTPGKPLNTLMNDIKTQGNPVREYLAGPVLDTLKLLIIKTQNTANASMKLALYEFDDQELLDAVMAIKDRVHIVLSNTSKNSQGQWDTEDAPFRNQLHAAGVDIEDRFFNNNSIGHNKFAIYLENNVPKAVMTGSTNWTPNGLCAQSNNASIIYSDEIAGYYSDYFDELKQDNASFDVPNPTSAQTTNVQGQPLRTYNAKGNLPTTLSDGTNVSIWFSPNTPQPAYNAKNPVMPPDLAAVYSAMRKAEDAIFFAVFLPGASNNGSQSDVMTNIITEAISIGQKDPSVLIYGSISSPTAMPNYVNPRSSNSGSGAESAQQGPPTTYDTTNVHLVRATNITAADKVGNFSPELLSAGFAIIHNKIVVVDPFSDNPIVIFGSHNLGFKASYGNDENLVIISGNTPLVQAYAVHVLDIYEHYRFRAIQQELKAEGKPAFSGFLSTDDSWLTHALSATGKGTLADYMCS